MRIKGFIRKNIILLVILVLATFLRVWHLDRVPPSLTPDEASLGYNAYSVLKTGKDEYGKFLPIIFKSFGDYKPGLYVYLTVPFVAGLGLNEVAVRLPSALAGVVSVFLIYQIMLALFREKKLALISAFILAITPWSIYFSRGAWEANFSLALTLAGILFFLKSFENNKYIILSSLFFALTVLTYQGAKLATGVTVILLGVSFWKEVKKIGRKYLFSSALLGVVIAVPIIMSAFSGDIGRLRVFSIFSYPRTPEKVQMLLSQGGEEVGSLTYSLFHTETLNFKRAILGRWFNHFSARFLFFEGDYSNPRHSAPYQGMLLISDIILLALGFWVMAKKPLTKQSLFIFLWLVLAPLPSILSRNEVHAVRALNMVIPLVVILSFGLQEILSSKFFKIAFFGALGVSFVYFLDAYFIHVPNHNSQLWAYGYKEVVETIIPVKDNYKEIKVEQSFNQPYIYFLFYQKYDPARYQKQAGLTASENIYDVGFVTRLDNISFTPINWSADSQVPGTLVVADPLRFPTELVSDNKFEIIKEIKYLNNLDTAFRIVEVK